MIPKEEFTEKLLACIEHAKRKKMWLEGHLDEEIALVCKVSVSEIREWRKNHGYDQVKFAGLRIWKPASKMSVSNAEYKYRAKGQL